MLLAADAVRRMATLHFKIVPRNVPFVSRARRAWGSVAQQVKRAPNNALPPDADIEHAIRVGCGLAGRQIPDIQLEKLCETLRTNWFSSARDIAAMSEDECVSIGFPLRLKNTIADAIIDEEPLPGPSSTGARPASDDESSLVDRTMHADAVDMEACICPPLDRFGFSLSDVPKGMYQVTRSSGPPVSLTLAPCSFTKSWLGVRLANTPSASPSYLPVW